MTALPILNLQPEENSVLSAALCAARAGIAVIPSAQDGTKRPLGNWKRWQRERPSLAQVEAWFGGGSRTGLGFVLGEVSGGLECLEFETEAIWCSFKELAAQTGLDELLQAVSGGYLERSPGGGVHLLYRCDEVDGNTRLARRVDGDVLIETRGQGGFVIVAPTHGAVHPTGRPYVLLCGGPESIVTICPADRQELFALAKSLGEMPCVEHEYMSQREQREQDRPGDHFNLRASWSEILGPAGWVFVGERNGTGYWRRHGKERGVSATTNHGGCDLLYVFSTSTVFEAERGYSKFAAYASLDHSGDFSAAARELRVRGTGKRVDGVASASKTTTIDHPEHWLTDAGLAERLVELHGQDLRYCHPQRKWYEWTGVRWQIDDRATISVRAQESVQTLYIDASRANDKGLREAILSAAKRGLSANGQRSITTLAATNRAVTLLPSDIDKDPWLLNCLNGTLDLRNGSIRPHSREDLITKAAPVTYLQSARLDLWDKFLADITGGDTEFAAFLQRAVGYALTGDVSEEKFFFVHGPTSTGKSTFLEALKAVLGYYAVTADFEAFLRRQNVGGPRADIARLAGARLVISIEVDRGKKLAEGLIKMLTGGDTVTARHFYQESFEYVPQFKLWLAANDAPEMRDEDAAIWRRIIRVPFEVTIPEDKRDPQVKRTLKNPQIAGPAILAWAVQGCLQWQRDGLRAPESVRKATDDLRAQMDPLAGFLDECCCLNPSAWTSASDLREAYETWARTNGESPLDTKAVAERLKTRGCESERRNPGRGWRGLGLADSERSEEACRHDGS